MNSSLTTARSQCLTIITRLVGEAGVAGFLGARQPALGDRTGAQLLQADPEELLSLLQAWESTCQRFDDALVGDPDVERFARPLKRSTGNRLIALLDELDRSEHE